MDNRSISHTRWKCQYHIVFIPKYRKKVLYGKVRDDVREIINTLCKYKNVECFYCDNCSDQATLYEFEGRQLCIECIKKLLPLVEGSEIYDF